MMERSGAMKALVWKIPRQWVGRICLFWAFTFAGTGAVAGKFLSGALGAFTIAAVSLLFALAFLLPFSAGRVAARLRGAPVQTLVPAFWQALFGIFLFRAFLLGGLARTGAVEAGVLTGATPAMTAVLAAVALREKVRGRALAGILFTASGVLLIQGIAAGGFAAEHLAGNLMVLCAAASEAVFNVLSRTSALKTEAEAEGRGEPLDPRSQTTLVAAIALILCLTPAAFERPFERLANINAACWLALFWYGVFVTALGFLAWYAGIRRCGALTAAAYSGMMPVTSMLLSVSILGEAAGWAQWAGCALVAAGMALIGGAGERTRGIRDLFMTKGVAGR